MALALLLELLLATAVLAHDGRMPLAERAALRYALFAHSFLRGAFTLAILMGFDSMLSLTFGEIGDLSIVEFERVCLWGSGRGFCFFFFNAEAEMANIVLKPYGRVCAVMD